MPSPLIDIAAVAQTAEISLRERAFMVYTPDGVNPQAEKP
jgi:hypothetical protein